MTVNANAKLSDLLSERYGEGFADVDDAARAPLLRSMAARGSCRKFRPGPVDPAVVRALCGVALASPTKSDLQQRDIVLIRDAGLKRRIAELVGGQAWVAGAPELAIFCGDNRRQRLLHDWRGHAFANDHLDAFFNAAVDAGVALSAFVTAAEALGLGCCPISAVRNEAATVSDLLRLPDHVFPVAGLAFGHPAAAPARSMRLPLSVAVHEDRYREGDLKAVVDDYDARRHAAQPYEAERNPEVYGPAPRYGWSEDKARQYNQPERADFGAFVRAKGFSLD